jgi:hypothetical protein
MAWAIVQRIKSLLGLDDTDTRTELKRKLVARAGRAEATRVYQYVDSLSGREVKMLEGLTGTALGDWGTGGDPELIGYTRLTGRNKDGKLLRELTPMAQDQQAQVAHFLYTGNPLGGWMIDQRVDLLVGGEVGYSVEFDPKKIGKTQEQAKELAVKVKEVLDKFWDHPAHNLRYRAHEYVVTLMVTGELCLVLASEDEVDGVPSLDYIDSQMIARVDPLGKSSMVPGTVFVRRKIGDDLDPKPYKIVRLGGGEDEDDERLGGECFYWRNSRILNSMRGNSELLRQADFLDSLDQFMFAQVDRAILQNNIVWDVTLEGATEQQLKQRAEELRVKFAKPGGAFTHNEKGKLEAVSPSLGAAEGSDLQRTLANHIRGSKSLPESWYSDGGNANRATAGDQTDVAYKTLEAWQTRIKIMLNTLLWYAYDNLAEMQSGAGFPKRSEGGVKIDVDLPPVRERDMVRAADTAGKLETALEAAVDAQFISRKTSRKVFLQVVEKLSGVTVDPDDEQEAIDAEAEEREKIEAKKQNDMARQALDNGFDDDDVSAPEPKMAGPRPVA